MCICLTCQTWSCEGWQVIQKGWTHALQTGWIDVLFHSWVHVGHLVLHPKQLNLLFILALKLPSSVDDWGKARLWVTFVFFHFYFISLWFRGWIGSMYLLISNYIQLTDYVLGVQFVVSVAMSNNRQTLVWRSKRAWAMSQQLFGYKPLWVKSSPKG